MESPSPQAAPVTPRRPGRLVAAVALFLLFLVVLGRWLSPNLTVGTTVADRTCDDAAGVCVEHVVRGEWLFLSPVDEWHVRTGTDSGRYYSADSPFGSDPQVTYQLGDGVSITDGTVTLTWSRETLARLGD